MEFKVHDDISIAKVSLKELFSNARTKSQLTEILAEAILEEFKGSYQELVVSYDDKVRPNRSQLLSEEIKTHNHEEADTIIPLHVIHTHSCSRLNTIDVWCPDTDVLILLMHLVANGHLGTSTRLRFLTGKGKKYRVIDIRDRVSVIGMDKSKGLIGLHHFTGAYWGGKFVGVSKKTWISNYLSVPPNDEIVRTFTSMGHVLNSDPTACKDLLDDGNLPAQYRPLEHFVCKVYSQQSTIDALPSLRWELFPPTRGTLIPTFFEQTTCPNGTSPILPQNRCFQLWK